VVETRDVVIVGGGFAGLSAGVALAERGIRVTLFEGKPVLGGRACSFPDSESGDLVDNGQHVVMGCYHQTLNFLEQIGTRANLITNRNLEIEMLDGPARAGYLRTAALPGPFHMMLGLMRYKHLTLAQRLGVLRAGMRMLSMRRFARGRLRRMTVAEFLNLTRQSLQARRTFWHPLTIATLNEQPQLASAALLAEVMKRAFFSRRSDSAFLYPAVGLSELYCTAAREFIEKRGGVVVSRAIVDSLEITNGNVSAVSLRDGAKLHAANFIVAVPPAPLLRMLPRAMVSDGFFCKVGQLQSSPIICVHVWLDREVTLSLHWLCRHNHAMAVQ
jgi:squalene-associated FAD-dependent desaturase